ncbi:hypothetical protein IEO21_10009 [Rhodonia placenta]|uniref:Uncharacterized protein n=1 Tax=Rhodonia placenta TaxID=104341 RepID=A0A8H7NTD7_9APHY|nr:hypothetical protein IEO21_10009 [Postia placenta]
MTDLKAYFSGQPPFAGEKADTHEWLLSLIVDAFDHPFKTLASHIHKIVPHATEVEHLFSSLDTYP